MNTKDEIIGIMTEAIDREVLAASGSAINAREADSVHGKLGGLMLAQLHMERALDMIKGVRALAATANTNQERAA